MSDIRKRIGPNGTGYQVRFQSKSTKSGYGFRTFKTRKEAVAFQQSLGSLQLPAYGKAMTVKAATLRWLEICEKTGRDGREKVEPLTLVEYERRARIIIDYPWTMPLHELVPADVVQFRQWLLENKSRDLARRTLSSFHSVILEMRQLGFISGDPAAGVTIRSDGRYEEDANDVAIPSDTEVKRILKAMDDLAGQSEQLAKAWARYKPMIYLALFTGMRPSEYRGLAWSNVERNRIQVRQRADKNGRIGPVKSKAGRRTIYIPATVGDLLRSWSKDCPPSELDLVFPTSTGKPVPLNNFTRRAWEPALRQAKVVVRETVEGEEIERVKYAPYALRHYFASKLIEKGKDLKFIQTAMGHADIQITLNVYGHLMKDRESEHIATAEELADDLIPA